MAGGWGGGRYDHGEISYTFCYLPSCLEHEDEEEREALQVLKVHDLNPVVCTTVT